eukprot:gb/GEZJ01006305.1/.p3 GENE.gb/GEZJ01006305.1/~~gb/GEZJ01006305.1/.p3  ORF type:complete len:110 (-),score=11.31 gb/GEZJ01006305.1/:173-502(-)
MTHGHHGAPDPYLHSPHPAPTLPFRAALPLAPAVATSFRRMFSPSSAFFPSALRLPRFKHRPSYFPSPTPPFSFAAAHVAAFHHIARHRRVCSLQPLSQPRRHVAAAQR